MTLLVERTKIDPFLVVIFAIASLCVIFIVAVIIFTNASSNKRNNAIKSTGIKVTGSWEYIKIEKVNYIKYSKNYVRPYFRFEFDKKEYILPTSCFLSDSGIYDMTKPVELYFNPSKPDFVLPVYPFETIES